MPNLPPGRTTTLASGLSAVLLLAACSGGTVSELNAPATTVADGLSTTAVTAAPTTTSAADSGADAVSETTVADEPQATSAIPSAMVTDLSTGETVDFASIAPADTPILLWMWAPH